MGRLIISRYETAAAAAAAAASRIILS